MRKSLLFVLPFLAIYIANILFYVRNEGDLIRIGYVYGDPLPKSKVDAKFARHKLFRDVSEIDLKKCDQYRIVIFGDSFSDQDSLGYQSRLAAKGVSVLNFDFDLVGNDPLQKVIEFLNSELSTCFQPEFVVYQLVEREVNGSAEQLDYTKSMDVSEIEAGIPTHTSQARDQSIPFFSDLAIKVPIANFQYLFTDRPLFSKTYRFATGKDGLFSDGRGDLLVYREDLTRVPDKNDRTKVVQTVCTLNRVHRLAADKGIKLIVLIAPDKYDVYQDFIVADPSTPRSRFFEIYNELDKDYLDVDAYRTLRELVETEEDVYYYDDSHWSPKGAAAVAESVYKIIRQEEGTSLN